MLLTISLPPETYLWFKSLHIIGVVAWFAGLFYLVRLFIYHIEAEELASPVKEAFQDQYRIMERRLANIIATPALVITIAMALGLIFLQPTWLKQGWMHAKLAVVTILLIYHWFCYRLMGQLARGNCSWSGSQLRALNELPTLLLVLGVMLVVFKAQFPTSSATWLVVFMVITMAGSIQFYARWRRLRGNKLVGQAD